MKCDEAVIIASLSVLEKFLTQVTKAVIPFSSLIVGSTLEVMQRNFNRAKDVMITRLGFILLSRVARYCGSAFQKHVPAVIPKVFETLGDFTAHQLVDQFELVYCSAQRLLLAIFQAIGPIEFTPFLKQTIHLTLLSPPENLNNALQFFDFFKEYSSSQISTIYYGSEINTLLSTLIPVILPALQNCHLLQSELHQNIH